MKKNNILKYLLPVVLVGLFASCKDSYPQPDFSKGTPIIELPVASLNGNGGGNSFDARLPVQTTPVDTYIEVNYAAPNPNTTDVTVNMAVDDAVFTKYVNAQNDTTTHLLKSEYYSLSNNITIPKGAGKVEYHIKVNTSNLSTDSIYAIPLKIVKASTGLISGNFGTLVLLVIPKNMYEGNYSLSGNITRNSSNGPDLTLGGTYKSGLTTALTTKSGTAAYFKQYWKDGSPVGGIDSLYLTVNQTTNKVIVASKTNATLKNTNGYDNRYDPATKTFYLAFDWGTAPNTRLAVDTLVYTGQ